MPEDFCENCEHLLFPYAGHLECPRCRHNIDHHDSDVTYECDDWSNGVPCAQERAEDADDAAFDSWDEAS
jgi:uncharacterized Zn finger protein (UPF0148 family)